MVLLQALGGAVGLMAYILLFFLVVVDHRQNFTAWLLATIIDFFVFYLTLPDGNWPLPLAYAIGSLAIAIALCCKKQINFDWWWDSVIICLVFACILIWQISETKELTIVSFVLASVISFAPQVRDTARDPGNKKALFWAYFIFLVGDILSFSGKEDNSAEEAAYSFAEIILSIVMLSVILVDIATKRKKEILR